MKTTRQQQKEQTKKILLDAAFRVFSEKGFLNTRMSDIALAAGVSHGTVFLHFNTQEAFITEVVDYYCGKIALYTHKLTDTNGTLRDFLLAHLNGINEFESFYTKLVIENRLLPPAARDAFITMQSAISFHFSQSFLTVPKPACPPDILFNMWMGFIHYYLSNGDLFAPEGGVIKRYGDTLIESFIILSGAKEV